MWQKRNAAVRLTTIATLACWHLRENARIHWPARMTNFALRAVSAKSG
jgi:hypothetical protein